MLLIYILNFSSLFRNLNLIFLVTHAQNGGEYLGEMGLFISPLSAEVTWARCLSFFPFPSKGLRGHSDNDRAKARGWVVPGAGGSVQILARW